MYANEMESKLQTYLSSTKSSSKMVNNLLEKGIILRNVKEARKIINELL